MTQPALQIREAAQRLRTLATAATPGPWQHREDWVCTVEDVPACVCATGDDPVSQADADFIAAMHPGVVLALVPWLEDTAADIDANLRHVETSSQQYALDVARLVLEAK